MNETFEESVDSSPKCYSDIQFETVFVNETSEEIYVSELENISEKLFSLAKVDLIDIKHEKTPDKSKKLQHSDEKVENVFIKTEILDEIHSHSCENKILTQQSNEHKLLLNNQEMLADYYEEFEIQSEDDHCQSQEASSIESNEKRNQSLFTCAKCEKHFIIKNELIEHTRIHIEDMSCCCDKCQEYFPSSVALTRLGNKKYSCSICSKSFAQKDNLKGHMLLHSNKQPHSCSICARRFSWRTSLHRHMLIHSNTRPYSCSICTKGFNQKGHLDEHKLTHSYIGSHSCSVCPKSFVWKSSLAEHMLVHSNNRRYSCTVCEKSFMWKKHLDGHMLVHVEKQSHSCPVCMKSFVWKKNLHRHMFIHDRIVVQFV